MARQLKKAKRPQKKAAKKRLPAKRPPSKSTRRAPKKSPPPPSRAKKAKAKPMAETHKSEPTAPVRATIARDADQQDVVVKGRPVEDETGTMKVTYNPGPGDPDETEVFGKKVKAGESVEVPARHREKIAGNPFLSADGKKQAAPKQAEPEPIVETTFDENVANERSKEYLEGRTPFANSPPGEAERTARAIQQAAELKAAQEDADDGDGKKRKAK